jgi:hypothetical protein
MTVCIAARSNGPLLLASDRMLTAGDIQFEPPVRKLHMLTSSIANKRKTRPRNSATGKPPGHSAVHHRRIG